MQIETQSVQTGGWVPRLVLALVAVVWVVVMEYIMSHPIQSIWVAPSAAALLLLLVWPLARHRKLPRPLLIGVAILWLSSVAILHFVGNTTAQHGLVILSVYLFLLLVSQHERSGANLQGRVYSFVMAMALTFAWSSILSLGIFLGIPWWWLTIIAAVVSVLVASILWEEAGIVWPVFRWRLGYVALLGAEVFICTWWLPTTVVVGAIVATTTLMLTLQTARHLWLNTWAEGRGRRYVAIGVTVCAAVLLTARWV